METRLLSKIGVTIVIVIMIIRGLRDIHRYMKIELPQQFIQLVKQAHWGQTFHTAWEIEVSDEMREALQLPLTPQQIHTLMQENDDIISRSVYCVVILFHPKGKETNFQVW